MSIRIQSNEVEVPELVGTVIEEFWGVDNSISKEILFLYITLSGISYRFFIDEGVLFWEEGSNDPEDDLEESQSYIDILSLYDVPLQPVKKIEMKDRKLSIILSAGIFSLEDCEGAASVQYSKSSLLS